MANKGTKKKKIKGQKCFIIMPFSKTSKIRTQKYWTEHFSNFLQPLIEENTSLKVHRSKPLRGDILKEIITDLIISPVVVADLTDANPNVYWELGVRQSFKHGTITIAKEGTKIPFDIGGKGTLYYYPKDHIKMSEFRKDFIEALQDCLKNPDKLDSHVLEYLSGRGTLYEIIHRDETHRRLEAIITELARNVSLHDECIKTAKINVKLIKEGEVNETQYKTVRFRSTATMLLISHRYIDAKLDFYLQLEDYLDLIDALNTQLDCWKDIHIDSEDWFIKYKSDHEKIFKKIDQLIQKAYLQ